MRFASASLIRYSTVTSCPDGARTSGPGFARGRRTDYARISVFLRQTFPHATAKHVATALDVSTRTVEGWLSGDTQPGATQFAAMVQVFGLDFLAFVMPDPPDWLQTAQRALALDQMKREQARLEAEISALEQDFAGTGRGPCA